MITRNKCFALICFFASVKLTSSTEFYLVKVLKSPATVARNEHAKEKLYLKIFPLAKSLKKVNQRAKAGNEKYGFPCRPGQICIGKVQHNQNSVVINNGLRDPSVIPRYTYNYYQYLNILDDTTDTDEYIEMNDDYTPFSDLTRFDKINKQKRDTKRKNTKESVSTDYFDVNDLLRSKNNNLSQNYRKADVLMIESQGKQYMRVDSSDYSENSENTDDSSSESTETEHKKESTEVEHKRESTEVEHKRESTEFKHNKRIPKRFAVVHNHNKKKKLRDSSSESKSESDDLENFIPIPTPKPKKRKPVVHKKKYIDNFEDTATVKNEVYIQRPGKYINLGSSSEEYYRRRLEHFLPKRYHWKEDDFTKLGYYWFNGPQGKNPGPWRINY